jgi:shikimate dehydrogenase
MKSTALKISTDWDLLCTPRICGLLARQPTSFSRVLHTTGFMKLGLPFSYHAFSVSSLDTPVKAMREMGIRGYSITIPFKEQIIPLLDTICPHARSIGAVNTLINSGTSLYGINTDWIGVRNAFAEVIDDFSRASCLILGAGGAAKAAAYAMQHLQVKEITFVNRTHAKAELLADAFTSSSLACEDLSSETLKNYLLIINTTPGISLDWFPYEALDPSHTVLEMVTAETQLSRSCIQNGSQLIPGIRMLFHQGLEQFMLFTEHAPPETAMEQALTDEFQKCSNF